MLENFYTFFEFLFFYLLFTFGDYSLYITTNKLHDLIINKKIRTSLVEIPSIVEWSIGNSISYIFIYMIYTNKIGVLYYDINKYNSIYTFISPSLYLLTQDFIFYVMHRTVHTPFLYKNIHYTHHKFRYPTSWVGRISHWLDSNIENVAFTLPAMFIPINLYIWKACLILTMFWGNFIHDNTNKVSIKYINDNTDHCLHHYYGEKNCNYSYYFNHWDKFFGTYKKMHIICDKIDDNTKINVKDNHNV
jgi:lathosterol oxidase